MGYDFTLNAAKQIVAAVKKVQSMSTDTAGQHDPQRALQTSFFAMITGANDLTGTFYDWVAVTPNNTSAATVAQSNTLATNLWQFQQPYVAGFGNAREANDNKGVEEGTVVRLTFVCYAMPNNTSNNNNPGTITQASTQPPTSPDQSFSSAFDTGDFDNQPQLPIPIYVFSFQPPQTPDFVPLHDHRDNAQSSGGFSFSIFHPGTNLPQQNWSA